ncbi:MAG TPA: hemerythrin domain-containing protein [Syntrophobacteraceae bacterium]|nr:hemerythrin domain-containing protein [Syntrophobacteraceae bacterium]
MVPRLERNGAGGNGGRSGAFDRIFHHLCGRLPPREGRRTAVPGPGGGRGLPERGPIGVMLAEHNAGRGYVRALRSALADLDRGNRSVLPEVERQAEGYVRLLREHMEKENRVLFRIAEDRLTRDVKDCLKAGFERIEAERVGNGRGSGEISREGRSLTWLPPGP